MLMQLSDANKSGVAGFGCSLAFLAFVAKFNDHVQAYKLKNMTGGAGKKIEKGLWRTLSTILGKTCGRREMSTASMLALSLLLRTFGSVWVAKHWGKIVRSLIMRQFPEMRKLIAQFGLFTISLAVLNALLKYYIATLKDQIREKVTRWCHEKYLRKKDMIFYKANKVGDHKIENCDHQITSDVDKFSEIFAMVLSQSLKPVVDFVVYSVVLSRIQGLATPLTLYGWYAIASMVSTVTLPPFGQLAAREQQLEGNFRGAHNELITNCEQIAFLGGEGPEKRVLDQKLASVLAHLNMCRHLNFNSEVVRQYLNKYFVTVIGLTLVARPVRLNHGGMGTASADKVSQYFVSTWRNMEAISTSIQDLFELTNRIGRLSGFASRVSALMQGLEERPPVLEKEIQVATKSLSTPIFKRGEDLKFEEVSVYRPDGTLLVANLSFEVKRGSRILVTGGNGCGKSSLFRVIRKLWPLVSGTITMPGDKDIYFLTQVNFVPQGSLLDLVIYPHTSSDMTRDGRTEEEVMECLAWACCSPDVMGDEDRADLQFTVDGKIVRPALSDVRDWGKDLSPGQKQKLSFARLFYHRPKFVVLDECTNGISPDVEQALYDRCTRMNLGIFSISHKIELKAFHDFELHYRGDLAGSWDLLSCKDTAGLYVGKTVAKGGVKVRKAISDMSDLETAAHAKERGDSSPLTRGGASAIADGVDEGSTSL